MSSSLCHFIILSRQHLIWNSHDRILQTSDHNWHHILPLLGTLNGRKPGRVESSYLIFQAQSNLHLLSLSLIGHVKRATLTILFFVFWLVSEDITISFRMILTFRSHSRVVVRRRICSYFTSCLEKIIKILTCKQKTKKTSSSYRCVSVVGSTIDTEVNILGILKFASVSVEWTQNVWVKIVDAHK